MKVTVTQKHLKQALSEIRAKDNQTYCDKCILAVASRPLFPNERISVAGDLRVGEYLSPTAKFIISKKARTIMSLFDDGFGGKKTAITKLRSMLPTTLVLREVAL